MRLFSLFLSLFLFISASSPLYARSLIRDAEIEDTLQQMSAPLFAAADLSPQSVRIFIINDPSINAFVAGGMNIFFHTGLLLKADTPEMLMSVIAHEAGHIAGAHLSQLNAASQDASLGALLSYVLGAAAALGGSGEAASAIISAGQNTSMRQLLSHYRGNEQQADEAAVSYLTRNQLSPQGMLEMFELLRRKEKQRIGGTSDPYLRTHPLTTDRIAAVRTAVEEHKRLPDQVAPSMQTAYARMQAKLSAFLHPPGETLDAYPVEQKSEAAHLARAVAYFRQPDIAQALKEIDALIALSPDAFSYDLKGQILFELGKLDDAIKAYEQAHAKAPDNGLIMRDLGRAYVETGRLDQAIEVLQRATNSRQVTAQTYRSLATAYGKQGQLGQSYLALAREAALRSEPDAMIRHARAAQEKLPENSPSWLQAQDLIADATRLKKQDKETLF